MRRLVLIRHAKAAVGDLDRRRPLTPDGMTAAEGIGRYLADNGPAPDRIVTSPARRAAETWAAAARALTNPPEPDEDERVYDNTVDSLQELVRDTPPDVGTLVVVGHNPSMRDFAHATDDGTGDVDLRKTLAERFPTAAVAVFDITEDWATLDQGTLPGLHSSRVRRRGTASADGEKGTFAWASWYGWSSVTARATCRPRWPRSG